MAKDKKSFLLYCDLIHTVKQLPNDKAGELFKHILSYVNDEDPITDDLVTNISFEPIKQQLKRDLKKYESICDRNSNNGKKGGRPKKQEEPKKPTGLIGLKNKPKKADSDTDTDTDNEKDIKSINNNEFIKKCLSDKQWIETISMQNKLKLGDINKILTTFENNLISKGTQHLNIKEFKNHFTNWLNLNKGIKNNKKPTDNITS